MEEDEFVKQLSAEISELKLTGDYKYTEARCISVRSRSLHKDEYDDYHRFKPLIEILIHHGTDEKQTDKSTKTPLLDACLQGHNKTHSTFLDADHGIKLNKALFSATVLGHPELVRNLLQCGADVNYTVPSMTQRLQWVNTGSHGYIERQHFFPRVTHNKQLDNDPILYCDSYNFLVEIDNAYVEVNRRLENDRTVSSPVLYIKYPLTRPDTEYLKIMKILLFHGADTQLETFKQTHTPINFIHRTMEKVDNDELFSEYIRLLLAAGAYRIVDVGIMNDNLYRNAMEKVTPSIAALYSRTRLIDPCRGTIIKHLTNYNSNCDENNNLLQTVPKLPLPKRLKAYLMYDIDLSWIDDSTCPTE